MAVEVAEAYVSIIPSARGFGAALAAETEGAAGTAGSSAGASFSSQFIGGLGKLAVVGATVGAALGAAAVGAGVGLFKIGSMFDDAFDKIRVTTGKTGAELGGLEGSFKTVFSNVPTNAEDASSAIATLNQKLGLSGQPLEGLATQLLNLSHITGTDLQSNMSAAVDVFNSFGISAADQPAKLDELFRASQATGVGVADLASTMASAGPNLQQLGLNFEQSAGLVAIFGKAGVDVGAVLPALSKTIVSAAKDGKNAGDVFRETFDAIKNAPNDTAGAAAAIDTFGAKAGPKLAGLIRQGKLGYEELAAAIGSGGDTINQAAADTADFGEKWNVFKNKILVGLEPLASKVFGAVGDAMVSIGPKIGPVIDEIARGFTAFFAAFKAGDGDVTSSGIPGVMEKIANGARQVFEAIKGIDFKAVFAGVVEFITPIADAVGKLAAAGFDLLSESLKTVGKLFEDNKATIETVAAVVQGALLAGITALTAVFGFLADHMGLVKAVIIPLIAAFAAYQIVVGVITVATTIWTAAQAALNVVMALNPIGLVVAAIAALVVGVIYAYTHFETFRNIVDGFWQALQAVFNWVVSNWQLIGAVLFAPIALAVLLIVRNWDTIKGAFEAVFNFIVDHWQLILAILIGPIGIAVLIIISLWDQIKAGFGAVVDFISNAVSTVIGVLTSIFGAVWGTWESLYEAIKSGIDAVSSFIGNVIGTIIGVYVSIFGAVWGTWSALYEAIKSGISAVSSTISGAIDSIVSFFTGIYDRAWGNISSLYEAIKSGIGTAKDAVSTAVDSIVGFITGIPGRIAGNFAGIFSGLVSAVESAADSVGNAVDRIKSAINSIPGAGIVKGIVDAIPHFAAGGVVTKPTLAVIGEAGPEMVIPLNMYNRTVDQLSSAYSPDMATTSTAATAGLGGVTINAQTNASPDMIARELSWQMRTAGV